MCSPTCQAAAENLINCEEVNLGREFWGDNPFQRLPGDEKTEDCGSDELNYEQIHDMEIIQFFDSRDAQVRREIMKRDHERL